MKQRQHSLIESAGRNLAECIKAVQEQGDALSLLFMDSEEVDKILARIEAELTDMGFGC
jgi:hypothetical protein